MKIFRRLFYVFLSFIIALNTMGLIVYSNETHSAENSHKQCALDETPDDQILSGNDPCVTVFVTNTYITDSSGTKYNYNVFLNTNAGISVMCRALSLLHFTFGRELVVRYHSVRRMISILTLVPHTTQRRSVLFTEV